MDFRKALITAQARVMYTEATLHAIQQKPAQRGKLPAKFPLQAIASASTNKIYSKCRTAHNPDSVQYLE